MMIRLLIFLASLFLFGACASSESVSGTRAERVVSEIHDPASKKVLVASHRGDWRNYPENSLPAIRSAIEMGVDIVEIDLALTSDSVFQRIVPWLLLVATALFALAPQLRAWSGHQGTAPAAWKAALGMLAVAAYGGYFNGGLGILLLALLGLLAVKIGL